MKFRMISNTGGKNSRNKNGEKRHFVDKQVKITQVFYFVENVRYDKICMISSILK